MPKPTDFTTNMLSEKELRTRQKYLYKYDYIAMDTSNYYQIDVDEKNYIEKVEHLLKELPYFLSSSKNLPHIIYKSKIEYENKRIPTIYKYTDKKGKTRDAIEILSGQWSYVNKNAIVYNSEKEIQYIELDFIDIKNKKKPTKNNVEKTPKSKIETASKESENKLVHLNNEKYNLVDKISVCYNMKRLDIYDDWIKLLFAFKNELGEEGYKIFDKISLKSQNYNEQENKKIWNMTEIRLEGKRKTIKHLINWAIEDNESKYREIMGETDELIECEKDIAEYIIKKYLGNLYICTDVKSRKFYYFNKIRWIEDINNTKLYNIITFELVNEFNKTLQSTEDINKKNKLEKIIKKLKGKMTYYYSIVDHISILNYDHEFISKLDENPDLIGFNDCIYDLSTKEARCGKPEDYVTKTVGYNYPKEYTKYKEDIMIFLTKVFPKKEIRDYVLRHQAQALSGRKGKDLIFTHTGLGGNGKSIEIEIMKYTFGQYYVNIPIKMLTIKNNESTQTTPDPFLSTLKGIRYASSNEPPDGSKVNDSFIKNIGSQEEQSYRLLFSNIINKLILQLKLHIYCNEKLKLKGDDGGLKRRMVVINYISKFDEIPNEKNNIYKADYSLSDKVKLWRSDYIKMLIDLYDINYKYTCPKEIEEASQQYMDDNNDVLKFIKDNLIMTNGETDYILLKDLKELYKNNKEYDQTRLKNLKDLLQQNMNTIVYDRKKIVGKDYRSVIIGWKYIDDENI